MKFPVIVWPTVNPIPLLAQNNQLRAVDIIRLH